MIEPKSINNFVRELIDRGVDEREIYALVSSAIPTAPPAEAWTGAKEFPVIPLPIALLKTQPSTCKIDEIGG
jgi:hypothetical protein